MKSLNVSSEICPILVTCLNGGTKTFQEGGSTMDDAMLPVKVFHPLC